MHLFSLRYFFLMAAVACGANVSAAPTQSTTTQQQTVASSSNVSPQPLELQILAEAMFATTTATKNVAFCLRTDNAKAGKTAASDTTTTPSSYLIGGSTGFGNVNANLCNSAKSRVLLLGQDMTSEQFMFSTPDRKLCLTNSLAADPTDAYWAPCAAPMNPKQSYKIRFWDQAPPLFKNISPRIHLLAYDGTEMHMTSVRRILARQTSKSILSKDLNNENYVTMQLLSPAPSTQ